MNPLVYFQSPDVSFLTSSNLENQFYERKRTGNAEQIAEVISAFSNSNKEGGLIIIGIENNGSLCGIYPLGWNWENNFVYSLSQIIHENVYECKKCTISKSDGSPDNIFLIYVKFSPNKLVEKSNGDAFIRIADNTVKLNDEKKLELRHSKGEISFENEFTNELDISQLDQDIVNQFLTGLKEKDNIMNVSVERVLISKHLAEYKDEKIFLNNAGLLLLSKDPLRYLPGAKLRFIKYDGKEELQGQSLNIVKDQFLWLLQNLLNSLKVK